MKVTGFIVVKPNSASSLVKLVKILFLEHSYIYNDK